MKKVYYETYGCQMNRYDQGLMKSLLRQHGYTETEKAADADLIIVNTCSVRERAEQRALARIQNLKVNRAVLAVTGCMAERMGKTLFEQVPEVDIVLGPDRYEQLPELLSQNKKTAVSTGHDSSVKYSGIIPDAGGNPIAETAIMRGCNNFCSYCIVPFVRGPEKSRTPSDILSEIKITLDGGAREICLLGQNVNSYRSGTTDFPALLRQVNALSGNFRIRFLTSHPKDFSEELIFAIRDCEKVCEHIHLPLQAGSNPVLKRMNRRYTREDFGEKLEKLRSAVPGVSVTSDIIVGFPGETDADFEDTLDCLRNFQFDEAFTYHYSKRSGTAAAALENPVPEELKKERLQKLIDFQRDITREKYDKLIGEQFEILIEKSSTKIKNQWLGRTRTGRPVLVERKGLIPGQFCAVEIKSSTGANLIGACLCGS